MTTSPKKKTKSKNINYSPRGGEAELLRCLKAGEPCIFDESLSQAKRTIRGEVLSTLLSESPLKGRKEIHPLPHQTIIKNAYISGTLDFFDRNCGVFLGLINCEFENAVNFVRATFKQLVLNHSRFSGLNISGSEINGQFRANDAIFMNPNGKALNAQGLKTKEDVFVDRAEFKGEVSFSGADIGGQFSANDATFENPNGDALNAQGLKTKEDVFIKRAEFKGEVSFSGADIGGQFSANDATFENPNGNALYAQRLKTKESVFIDRAEFKGKVSFSGADISGQFYADQARFENSVGDCLNLQDAKVQAGCYFREMPHAPIGPIDLADLNTTAFMIDENFYPYGGINFDGAQYQKLLFPKALESSQPWTGWLTPPKTRKPYDKFTLWMSVRNDLMRPFLTAMPPELPLNAKKELDQIISKGVKDISTELNRQATEFTPGPWYQFASVLDKAGLENEARAVRIELSRRMTAFIAERMKLHGKMPITILFYRLLRFCYRIFGGYGFAPFRTFRWWTALLLSGWAVFALWGNYMTPAKERLYLHEAYADYTRHEAPKTRPELPKGYPEYNSFIYSLDVMLPIVDFGQETHWRPANVEYHRPNWLRWYNRLHLMFGWFLTTFMILGFTGLIKDK